MIDRTKPYQGNIPKFMFPKRCPYCLAVIRKNETLCGVCKNEIYVHGVNFGVSGYRCCSPLLYKKRFRHALHKFKFKGRVHLSFPYSQLIYKQIQQSYPDFVFDYVTYVPMHRIDETIRGYNQSEILAQHISQMMGIPCVDTIAKIKRTIPQHDLNAKDRKTNLKGVFKVKDKALVKERAILIIDDVATTGTTLSECAKVLEKEKPSQICCATLFSTGNLY